MTQGIDGQDWPEPEPKPITEIKPKNLDGAMDLRGTPTSVCVCGCDLWIVYAKFDEDGMTAYFLDMQCAQCGSMATAPMPNDGRTNDEHKA